jgi:hypothetical protein
MISGSLAVHPSKPPRFAGGRGIGLRAVDVLVVWRNACRRVDSPGRWHGLHGAVVSDTDHALFPHLGVAANVAHGLRRPLRRQRPARVVETLDR